MQTRRVTIEGPGARGVRVNGPMLRDLLTLLIEGSQRSLRVRTQGRSTARGALPRWISAATEFDVQILEGSTVLQIEAPSLLEAAPDEFRQGQLFPEIDPHRAAVDYFIDSMEAALGGEEASALYDSQLLNSLERLESIFSHGVTHLDFERPEGGARARPLRVTRASVPHFRELEARIPRPQHVLVAGKLDTIRHSDRTFVLKLANGTNEIRGIAEQCEDLQSFWGQHVLVSGTAHFTAAGGVQRVEAESLRPASERDLSLFEVVPVAIRRPIEAHAVRQPQGPRSGLNAIIGKWPGDESDEQIREALDLLS